MLMNHDHEYYSGLPAEMPFTISVPDAYYAGYLDLPPDRGMGYHVKDEMGGLWIHPVRVFRSIYVEGSGKAEKPTHVSLSPYSAKFSYGSGVVILSAGMGHHFSVESRGLAGDRIIAIDMQPQAVWMEKSTVNIKRIGNKFAFFLGDNAKPEAVMDVYGEFTYDGRILKIKASDGILLSADGRDTDKITAYDFYDKANNYSILKTNSEDINEAYSMAKTNLLRLYSVTPAGKGITAGHPDFPWYFGIDTLLTAKGALAAGFVEEIRDTLLTLMRFTKNGRIPHEIVTNGFIFNQGDLEESAYFASIVSEYLRWTNDRSKRAEMLDIASRSIEYVYSNGMKGRGIMEDAEAGTGIDIDTVVFLLSSIRSVKKIQDMPQPKIDMEYAENELLKLADRFWMPEAGTYANRIVDGVPMDLGFWTSIVPFYFGFPSRSKYSVFLENGLKRISDDDSILVSTSGNVMPINTGMMAIASINYADDENADRFFRSVMQSLGKFSPGSFHEISNNPQGCYLQAWSASIFIEILFYGYFGVDTSNGRISMKRRFSKVVSGQVSIEKLRFKDHLYSFRI